MSNDTKSAAGSPSAVVRQRARELLQAVSALQAAMDDLTVEGRRELGSAGAIWCPVVRQHAVRLEQRPGDQPRQACYWHALISAAREFAADGGR
jgi:hypothetical protein